MAVAAPPTIGVRKEVEVDERQVLLFWYRNQIYCIEARSPAEGAYSEGFIKAKFTQASDPRNPPDPPHNPSPDTASCAM